DGLAYAYRQPIRDMTTFVENDPPHTRGQFPGTMIDRASFDADLVRRAEAAGTSCALGVSLSSLDAEGVARLSDGRAFAPRVIVGADGPRSAVGAAIGIVNRELAETRQITVPLLQPFAET